MKASSWILTVFVLVIAGVAIWSAFNLTKDELVEDDTPTEVVVDEQNTESESGSFIVYKKTTITDRGTDDAANDDIEEVEYFSYSVANRETRKLSDDEVMILLSKEGYWKSADGAVVVTAENSWNEGDNNPNPRLTVAYLSKEDERDDKVINLDPAELGIDLGYAWPVGLSLDGSSIYLRQIFEGEGWLSGFWRYDLSDDTITRCQYCDENHLKMPDISTEGPVDLMIATSFNDPESLGEPIVGPSKLHLVTLSDFQGQELLSDENLAYILPTISPSGNMFSFNYGSDTEPYLWVMPVMGDHDVETNKIIQGQLIAWIDDTKIVVDRSGEIVVVDLTTKDVASIDRNIGVYSDQDYQTVEFIKVLTN